MQPRVSVIIPTYNTASLIGDTLDSVFRQTFSDFEVLVINDDSPDTAELERVLQRYGNRVRYFRVPHQGVSAARNHGIHQARGEFLAFLDSDDLWQPNYLELQVAMLDRTPDADLVYSDGIIFGQGASVGSRIMQLSPSRGPVTFISVVQEECCVTVSLLARKEAIERAGLFDENLKRSEDFDLWLRCLKSGSKIIYHREPLLLSRRREGSLSYDTNRMAAAAAEVLRKMLRTVELTDEERTIVERKILQFQGKQHFFEGRQAFMRGDLSQAIECLSASNKLLNSTRIRVIIMLLRRMPRLVQLVHTWKHRVRFNRAKDSDPTACQNYVV